MKTNEYGKIYFIKQQSYKDKSFSPLLEINSNFDLLKSIELGTGRAIGITSNDELLEWKYEKKKANQKKQDFPFLICKPVYHFHKIKFGKVLMNKTMCLAIDLYGNVLVWGEHKDGLLGLGYTITLIENPTKLECLKSICEIALSDNHAVAINSKGDAFSWGTGKYGELGLEKSIYTPTPLRVNTTRSYSKVFVGNLITCFLDTEGQFSYFGVIIKILKGTFSTITVKNLLTDQNNSDPNTLFEEKIIDELENEPFVFVSIGNGFIALLSKKGMVYSLEYSDKLTLLYSKYFVYSLTVSNNQIIGLSYDKYNNYSQVLSDQSQLKDQQLYYLCQWVSKASDQEVSNEIWLTLIYKITEELHLDNILLINTNNRNLILFLEKGMNLNTSVLFPNRNNNDNTSHDISWDNITYNELPIASLGLMRKSTQKENFLVFDSEYDDSYNMKFKRSKLSQPPKNSSINLNKTMLNRTMMSEAKSSINVLSYHKSHSSTMLGPLTERNNNKRLFSSDSSNKKFVPNNNDDEIVTMKNKELQDYQKEIDSIISNLKYRQKEKTISLQQRLDQEAKSNHYNDLYNTNKKRHNTIPNPKNEVNKSSFEQGDKKYIYSHLDTSNPNIETKNNMSDIEGLFNKTNNDNTEIKNDAYSDAEEVNLFNKSNLLDESNQLKLSANYVYVNPNKSNFLSPQFIKTNKMSQLYSSKESIGKTIIANEEDLISKIMTSSNAKQSSKRSLKTKRDLIMYNQQRVLFQNSISKDKDNYNSKDRDRDRDFNIVHYNTENNEMNIEERINTNPTNTRNNKTNVCHQRAFSDDGDLRQSASYHYQCQDNYNALKSSNTSYKKVPRIKHSLSYGYKMGNLFSRNNQGRHIYNIDEEERNYYLSNDGIKKYFLMSGFDDNENRGISDRTHYIPLKNNMFNQDNSYLDANNPKLIKLNKHNAFMKRMESNKMSTIVYLENSSNFAHSNDDIFEETPKFETKNLHYINKDFNGSSNLERNIKGSLQKEKKNDTKLNIADLVNENENEIDNDNYEGGNNKMNSNSNTNNYNSSSNNQQCKSQKKDLTIKTNKGMIQLNNSDKRISIEVDNKQNKFKQCNNNKDDNNNNNDNDKDSQSIDDEEYDKHNQSNTNERNKGELASANKSKTNLYNNQESERFLGPYSDNTDNVLLNQNKTKGDPITDYNPQINSYDQGQEQDNNLIFSFDPAIMKKQMNNNQLLGKDNKMKDYDDIIDEVKNDDTFRKAFSLSGKIENTSSKLEFNSDNDNDNANGLNDNKQNAKISQQQHQKNNLSQSEEDLKQTLRLKQFENFGNSHNQHQYQNSPLSKQKKLIDNNEKINEDEGSNTEEDYEGEEDHNNNSNNERKGISKLQNQKQNQYQNNYEYSQSNNRDGTDEYVNKTESLNNKSTYSKESCIKSYDDLANTNKDSSNKEYSSKDNKKTANEKEKENMRSYESSSQSSSNDIIIHQFHKVNNINKEDSKEKKQKNMNSPRKNEDYLNSIKKKQNNSQMTSDSNHNPNNEDSESYDQTQSPLTNVFKYPSKNTKLNQNELMGLNANDNDTARLGGKENEEEGEEDNKEEYQLSSFNKEKDNENKTNSKLKSVNKYKLTKMSQFNQNENYQHHQEFQNEDYISSKNKKKEIEKSNDRFQYDDDCNLNDSDRNESNKTEFKKLLNQQQQKDYYNNNDNDNHSKGELFQDKISNKKEEMSSQNKKMNQTNKRKPNEINTQNPYDDDYNRYKAKKHSNRREHSPSENSSTEAKKQLRHLYQKNFGTKMSENAIIHHSRTSSMPITKGIYINPDDTFGYQHTSTENNEELNENNEEYISKSNKNKRIVSSQEDKQRISEEYYSSDKKGKSSLLIKIPNDESIIDLPRKGMNTEDEESNISSRKNNYLRSSGKKSSNSNVTDQKIFTLKGYSDGNDSSLQGNNRSNMQFNNNSSSNFNDKNSNSNNNNNKISNIAQYIENKSLDIDDSGAKPGERIVQLLNKIKNEQNQIADSITQNSQFGSGNKHNNNNTNDNEKNLNDDEYESQSSLSNNRRTSNQNNENVYTFSGMQPVSQQNSNKKRSTQTNKNECISESTNNSKGEMMMMNQKSKNNKKVIERQYGNKSKSHQDELQYSSEQSNALKEYDTQSSKGKGKGKEKLLKSKNESINYPKKIEDNKALNNQKKNKKNNQYESESPSGSDKGEKPTLISLVSNSKTYRGYEDKTPFSFNQHQLKRQGGKLIVNKNYMNYFFFLINDYMKKRVVLHCIGRIYYYQLYKEKKFACKIIFRLMRKRIIFYEIKFYHRGK